MLRAILPHSYPIVRFTIDDIDAGARSISMLVQQHLDVARTHVPEIPHPGSLNVTQGNYLINMMFDNVIMDMIMQGG
jgi:hypothetical protein